MEKCLAAATACYAAGSSPGMLNITRPDTFRPSIAACASAIVSRGNLASTSKPGHSPSSASFSARAAAVLASGGKSSLPRKYTRMFLKKSGQRGMAGAGLPVA